MPADRYLKFVLTVIAVALVALVIQNATRPAFATDELAVTKVAICDLSGRNCAAIFGNSDGKALHIYGHVY